MKIKQTTVTATDISITLTDEEVGQAIDEYCRTRNPNQLTEPKLIDVEFDISFSGCFNGATAKYKNVESSPATS